MMVSTKGRYALRVMMDLAKHDREEPFVSLKEVAERQNISMKYLEAIVAMLNKAGLVESKRGKEGGYRLLRTADKYNVAEILRLTEGSLAPVACMEETGCTACEQSSLCQTLPLWQKLDSMIEAYLGSVTLEDLVKGEIH